MPGPMDQMPDFSAGRKDEPHYVREAFNNQYNWILMAAAAGFAAMSVSPLPLIVGAGVELIYLSVVSTNERFRRLVRSQVSRRDRKTMDLKARESVSELTADRRNRYANVEKVCLGIRENYRQLSAGSQVITNQMEERLDGLRHAFLRLLVASQQHGDYLRNFDADAIKHALAQLEKTQDSGPDKIRAINRKRIEILNMRLEKLNRIHENFQVVNAQSAAIEDVLGLIRDQSVTMRDPQSVSNQLGDLVREVEQTESSVREMETLFESPSDDEMQALPAGSHTPPIDEAPRAPAGKAKI